MFKINNPYTNEYNKKYERRGTLFASRFKNIIISDARINNGQVKFANSKV